MKIALSGGFDPLHVGHLRMIKDAASYANQKNEVYVILNSGPWLERKKGYSVMSWADRAEILRAIRYVDQVVSVDDSDGTVVGALCEIMPDAFGNGGDRIYKNTPEFQFCKDNDIELVFGLGGGKIRSSSKLIQRRTK